MVGDWCSPSAATPGIVYPASFISDRFRLQLFVCWLVA